MGSIRKGSATLKRRRFWFHYPLQPSIRVRIDGATEQALLTCRVTVNPFGLAFRILWLGFAALLCVLFIPQVFGANVDGPEGFGWASVIPFGLVAVGVVALVLDLWLARRDADYLLKFVCERTGAQVV